MTTSADNDPDLPITQQGAREVIEDALTCLGDARNRGIADGLCAAFYMAHIITESEWHAYMKRIPAEVVCPKDNSWHAATEIPAHVGIYEVDEHDPAFAYWDGSKFGYRCWVLESMSREDAISRAMRDRDMETSCSQRTTWREIQK